MMTNFKLNIPGHRNSRLFILLSFFQNCWFTEGIWFFYWARFANYAQIGLLLSIMTIVWVIAEIPTGIFADKYGRKMAIMVGYVFLVIGGIWLALAQNIEMLFIGGLFDNIGRAFISGALEALVYDNLEEKNRQFIFDRLVNLRTQIGIFAFAVSVAIGGIAYITYFRLPNILFVLTNITALVLSTFLIEKGGERVVNKNLLFTFVNDTKSSIKELINSKLRPYLTPILLISIVSFVYDWGFSRPAMAVSFGFGPKEQSFIYALMAILSILAVGFVPGIRKRVPDYTGIRSLNFIMGLSFILSYLNWGYSGVIIMLIIEISWNMAEPWISIIINKNISSLYRATTLSTIQFISKLPFLIINILLGQAIDDGLIKIFHLLLGLFILCLLFLKLPNFKKIYQNLNYNFAKKNRV